jgi:hypothetical protein
MRLGIGRQRVSTETGRLRGRIGKEEPQCPLLRLAEVQTDPRDGTLPEGDFWTGIASEWPVTQALTAF